MDTMEEAKLKMLEGPIQIIGIRQDRKQVTSFDENYEPQNKETVVTTLCFMVNDKKYEVPLGSDIEGMALLGKLRQVKEFGRIDKAFSMPDKLCYCKIYPKNPPPYHYGSGSEPVTLDYGSEYDGFIISTFSGNEPLEWDYNPKGDVMRSYGYDTEYPIDVVEHSENGFTLSEECFTKDFDKEYLEKLEELKPIPSRLRTLMDMQREGRIEELEKQPIDVDPQEEFEAGKIGSLGKLRDIINGEEIE